MSRRKVIAYAITHAGFDAAGKPIKGGPYTGRMRHVWTLAEARRFERDEAYEKCRPGARVIRIVRARPSEASATLETARRRLAAVAEHMTEHAYQELASALEVDSCRVGPSEASAIAVLRELVAWDETPTSCGLEFGPIADRARRVLAGAGPDPMRVVGAALEETAAEEAEMKGRLMAAREARRLWVGSYRKAGGK